MSTPWRMKALCLAGRVILENGGETYRAEDTVIHMAQALGLCEVDVFGVPSGLFISATDEAGERETSVTRIFPRGTHLARVDAVNQISRRLASKELEPTALISALQSAARLGSAIPRVYAPLMAALSALGFAVMFGGGPIDMLVGAACAALTQFVKHLPWRRDLSGMTAALAGSLLCTLIPLIFHALTGLGVTDAMIASAIMPLLPGLSMTNAVQDILRGDMLSGVAHAAKAVMVAALVAGGALVGMHLFGLMGIGGAQSDAALALMQPAQLWTFWRVLQTLGSSLIAGMGFGALLFAPRKAILWGGVMGMVGYVSYLLVLELSGAENVAVFAAALLAAASAQLAARKLRMIATVFVTIAILPLVPGLGLYRAMSAFARGLTGAGLGIAAQTMALIVMIALGVGLGSAMLGAGRRLEG